MFKVFAVICIITVNPLGLETRDCQIYYETNNNTYSTQDECLVNAEKKAHQMFDGFNEMNIPFESMQFGCEQQNT